MKDGRAPAVFPSAPMPRRPRVTAWFTALIVAAATLALLGVRGLSSDAERVEERLRGQSMALARAVAEAVEASARELQPDGVERIALRASSDGSWASERAAWLSQDGPTPYMRDQVDALEREGQLVELRRKLGEWADRSDSPGIAAWALATTAAVERRAGDMDRARAALSRLLAEHPFAADERGLPRALAARWALCELDGHPLDALESVTRDLLEARESLDPAALAALAQLALDTLCARDSERCAKLTELDQQRQFSRRLRSSWRQGISNWLASGAPRGRAWFELAADPLVASNQTEYALLRASTTTDGYDVVALRGAALAQAALARAEIAAWQELGFGACIVDGAGRTLAGAPLELDADTVSERLPAPFDVYAVRARSLDIESARSAARQRLWTTVALALAVLAAAVLAAWLGIRALEREARAAHQREQFVAAVTHELKAPLASIRLLAELLEQGGVSEAKVREFGARTVTEADRLSRLISSVLEMARLDGGGAPREREEVLLRQLALETLRQFEPVALDKQIRVQLHPCDESLQVLASRDALGSALFELLTNASKYGGRSDIELAIEPRGERVVLAVLDRGPGVPKSEFERIFEPFQRLGDELTREQPGVGLGLALVRKVAQSHGGDARCVAREGGGSRFEIELPRAVEKTA